MLRILFSHTSIEESIEDKSGVILDDDRDGNSVGLRILNAPQHRANLRVLVAPEGHSLVPLPSARKARSRDKWAGASPSPQRF